MHVCHIAVEAAREAVDVVAVVVHGGIVVRVLSGYAVRLFSGPCADHLLKRHPLPHHVKGAHTAVLPEQRLTGVSLRPLRYTDLTRSIRLLLSGIIAAVRTGGSSFFATLQNELVDGGEQVKLTRRRSAGGGLCADACVIPRRHAILHEPATCAWECRLFPPLPTHLATLR